VVGLFSGRRRCSSTQPGRSKEIIVTNNVWASTFLWAQASGSGQSSGGAPAAASSNQQSTGQAEKGGDPAAQAQAQDQSFFAKYGSIIMIVLMIAVFYFLLIRPQQKKAKEHQKMIDSIGKGTEVVTNGGLIGKVCAVTGKTLTMEISEKVRVRVLRSQVAGIFDSGETEKK